MSMVWFSLLFVRMRTVWARLAAASRGNKSLLESNMSLLELMLVGARWATSGGRSSPVVGAGSSRARCGLSSTPWSFGAPVRGCGRSGVSTRVVPVANKMGRATKSEEGVSLDFPFGRRFAAAMLRQS
jgi:hypothetical protein